MSILDAIGKKIPADLFAQLKEALGEDFDMAYVPQTRFNAVIKQRNEYKAQLEELDVEPLPTKPKVKEAEPTPDKTKKEIEELQAAHAKEVKDLQVRYALTDELRGAKCKNPDLLISKFDTSKLEFDESGKLKGHADVLKKFQESDPYLFEAPGDGVPSGTGAFGGKPGSPPPPADKVDAVIDNIFKI